MTYHFSEESSRIIEYFSLYLFQGGMSQSEWDFSAKERHILRDVLPIIEELGDLFEPYREKIETYYFGPEGISLLHLVYFDLLNRREEPLTVEEVHETALSLSAQAIQTLLSYLVMGQKYPSDHLPDFWELLDRSPLRPEVKWHISCFYRQPLSSMQELVALSRQLIALYEPYYRKGQQERESFARQFSLEKTLETWLRGSLEEAGMTNRPIYLYIVSPWLIRLASYQNEIAGEPVSIFVASCRIDDLMIAREGFDLDDFIMTLKTISDSTRYQVLVELTKPHAKSKTIAEALNITGAAVSFHTQKLLNAQLLLLNTVDKTVKYDVNKTLLKDVIRKLVADLNLEI